MDQAPILLQWYHAAAIVGIILSIPIMMVFDIRSSIKASKKKDQELDDWVKEENKKPKFKVKVFTKSRTTLYSEPRDAYHMWLLGDVKVTSYESAHNYASNIMKSAYFRLGDLYIPTCDIKDVSVVSEKEVG